MASREDVFRLSFQRGDACWVKSGSNFERAVLESSARGGVYDVRVIGGDDDDDDDESEPLERGDKVETRRRLGKEKTILLSTHVLQEVEAMADRVIVINEGRLVADGLVTEFMGNGKTLADEFSRLTKSAVTAAE